MLLRQRGLSLIGVAVFSIVFAGVAMTFLMGVRHDRNYFAEGWAKVTGKMKEAPLPDMVAPATANTGTALRKCVVDGKTVISNVDCTYKNPTSKDIKIYDTKGFEAPKAPPPADSAPRSNPAIDKAIEKQMQ
jgi:hypothetical protein